MHHHSRRVTSDARPVVRRTTLWVVLALGAVALGLLPTPAAHADPVADLRSRAAAVSAEMSQLQAQIRTATTEVEQARYRAEKLDAEIADAATSLERARAAEGASRKELSSYALRAYMSGGASNDLTEMLGEGSDTRDQREGYVASAVGDRQELVDQLRASQQVTREKAADLQAKRAEAADVLARAETHQAEAQRAADRLATMQAQLQGELAQAVAEKQAAEQRAAEERARADAEARARADAARAQRVPSSAPVALPPVSGTDSSATNDDEPSGGGFVAPPNASAAQVAIAAARSQLGVPYSWGGGTASGPSMGFGAGAGIRGFDCSGLTLYAYAQAGVSLSHLTWDQMRQGQVVPLSQIAPGDLVFYWGGGHEALYIGGGQVIHAPRTGDVVRYGSLYMGTPELVVRPTA